MPDGGLDTGVRAVSALGGLGSGVGAVASLFQGKPKAPDTSALDAQAAQMAADAKAEKARIDAEEAERKKLRLSGNFGRRSLLTNGESGYTPTLGG